MELAPAFVAADDLWSHGAHLDLALLFGHRPTPDEMDAIAAAFVLFLCHRSKQIDDAVIVHLVTDKQLAISDSAGLTAVTDDDVLAIASLNGDYSVLMSVFFKIEYVLAHVFNLCSRKMSNNSAISAALLAAILALSSTR